MDRTLELGNEKIWKLLIKYSVPAVIGTMVNAIYNIVDRMFIGKFAGEDSLAALTIAFPVMMIIFAFATLISVGNAALLSIRFGEHDRKGANHVFCNSLSLMAIIMISIIALVFINFDAILSIFGADAAVLGEAKKYLRIILLGNVFQSYSFLFNGTARTEGHPRLSMMAMASSAVTNIILDYVFVVLLKWGVEGAAFATIIGMFVGLGIFIVYFLRGGSSLSITKKDMIPDMKVIKKIFSIGVAAFMGTVGTSVSMTILNRSLAIYGGTAAIASMGAINSLFTLVIMPLFGIQDGMQPIIGYNYGAGKIHRSYKTLKTGIMVGMIFSIFMFIMMQLFPKTFIGMFLNRGSETFEVAVNGFRLYILSLPILCINLMGITFFQATDNGRTSAILGMLRPFLILIPILIILPPIAGLAGVWLSVPMADFLAIIITVVALVINYNKVNKKKQAVPEGFANEY
jgi:putative MATE family efflux protein